MGLAEMDRTKSRGPSERAPRDALQKTMVGSDTWQIGAVKHARQG